MPRPTRLRSLRACAGFIVERLTCSAILDLDQMTDLPKHACERRVLVVLDGAADLAQPERPQRAAVPLRLPNAATNLRYPKLRHLSIPQEPYTGELPKSSCRGSLPRLPGAAVCASRSRWPSPC